MPSVERRAILLIALAAATGANPVAAATLKPATMPATPQVVPVAALDAAPQVDGELAEWGTDGWVRVEVFPAVEDDDQNRLGRITVELRVGVHGERIYLAARWPDARADTKYKPWEWSGERYRRGKWEDDMFAARFDLDGDYNSCMLADTEYRVDTWIWSAGRSNPSGFADDGLQLITTRFLDGAAEYAGPNGKTVYIKKSRDEGTAGYETTRPDRKVFQGDRLPGIEWPGPPSGSAADVAARATWADGHWRLEMARALVTGHADDAELPRGQVRVGAIAVFDRNSSEHKSVSGDLHFDLGALR